MRIALQGEEGCYSEEAARRHLGEVEILHRASVEEALSSVEAGDADAALIPVENTITGAITDGLRPLLYTSLRISGEVIHRISHCLIAHPRTSIRDIRRVYSHPQALKQCRNFLQSRGLTPVEALDTAGSVKMLRSHEWRDAAAIASKGAAEAYGMEILAEEIEDKKPNYTRFLLLSHLDHPPTGRDKTSLLLRTGNPSGLRGLLWSWSPTPHISYVEVEGHRLMDPLKGRMEEWRSLLKGVLGSYPRGRKLKAPSTPGFRSSVPP